MDTNSNQAIPSQPPPPNVPLSSSSGSSVPIIRVRAPLTVFDSDFEYSLSSNGLIHNSSSSYGSDYSGFGSEDFEEEFETASDRAYVVDPNSDILQHSSSVDEENETSRPSFVTDPDEEIVIESSHVEEYVFPRSLVRNPNERGVEESSFREENVVSRPFVTDPDEEIVTQSSDVEEYAFARLFVKNPGEETIEEPSFQEENVVSRPFVVEYAFTRPSMKSPNERIRDESTFFVSRPFVESPASDLGVLSPPKLSMPIALLSGDSNDGSVDSEVEDDLFPGTVRIPDAGSLENVIIAPKVTSLSYDEGQKDELQFEDTISGEYISGVSGTDGTKDTIVDSFSTELVEDIGLDIHETTESDHLLVSRDDNFPDEEVKYTDEVNVLGFNEREDNELQFDKLILGEDINEVMGSDEKKGHMEKDTVNDMGLNCNESEKADYFVASKDHNSLDSLKLDEQVKDLEEEVQAFEEAERENQIIERNTMESKSAYLVDDNVSLTSQIVQPNLQEMGVKILPENDTNINFGALFVDNNDNCENHDADVSDLVILSHGSDNEILQSEVEQITDKGVDSHDSVISNNTLEPLSLISSSDTDLKVDDKDVADHVQEEWGLENEVSLENDNGDFTVGYTDSGKQVEGEFEQEFLPFPLPSEASSQNNSRIIDEQIVSESIVNEEEEKMVEKIHQIRVKFLRIVQKLGLSTEDSIVVQVLYKLALASRRLSSQTSSLELGKRQEMVIAPEGKNELNFPLTILAIGKTGVGKSATINSIFGENKALTNAFHPTTNIVKEIVGSIDGVTFRVLDTPGFRSSVTDHSYNKKILSSIKIFMKKFPPDVVLYVDRVDTYTRNLNDLPLLRLITSSLGPSVWQNSIITLTHAGSIPPDGPCGSPLSYEAYVSQRCRFIQQMISLGVGGDMYMKNPVSLVENHPLCRKNGNGQKLLNDGKSWRPQLLLLCYSMKILYEASSLIETPHSLDHRSLLPLPYFLTSLLQSFSHKKFHPNQNGESVDSDTELGCLTGSDQEDADEYDQLPLFKPSSKSQFTKLSKEQRRAYFEEFNYRVKLLQKKGVFVWLCNNYPQFTVGRNCKTTLSAGLNNGQKGQISIRMISSEQLQIAALGLLPIANSIFAQFSKRY